MRDWISRGAAIAAAAGLVAAIGAGSAGGHTARYDTNVKLKERAPTMMKRGEFAYAGRVLSVKHQCEVGRQITLYEDEPGPVPPEAVGTTETDAEGKYSIVLQINPPSRYHTKASKSSSGGSGHEHTCKAGKSNIIDYSEPETRAHKRASFNSTIKITNYISEMGGGYSFLGKLKSENPNCKPDRKGKIFQRGPGDDVLVGKGTTNGQGFFSVPHEPLTAGRFYAKVGKDPIPAGACKGDSSPILEVN